MKALPLKRKYWAPLVILATVLAAHGGALDSIFYLDDWVQVHNSPYVEGGLWYANARNLLTPASYYFTWKFFGFSTFWFHAFNLTLHLAQSLAIYYLGRHLLSRDEGEDDRRDTSLPAIALLAALIFAAHPLNTEVVNYVRARDHGMVGLFSFLAAGFAALWMRRHPLWLFAVAGSIGLAALAKGPGLPQALLAVAIVVAACSTRARWRRILPNRWAIYGMIVLLEIGWFFLGHKVVDLTQTLWIQTTGDWRFGWHALTQCRVFWSYVQLAFWPSGLSSDHLVAWTRSTQDIQAWIAAGALGVLVLFVGWLWVRRSRPWAMLATLAIAMLGIRWLYVVSELMVEYRTYPAMPYVALLAALGIACWWRRMPRSATAFSIALIISYIVLSQLRSQEWSSPERLHASVLRQYPWQLRSLNGLSSEDMRAELWQPIIDRNPDFNRLLGDVLAENRRNPLRYYENWPLWAVTEDCHYAEALLHLKGPDTAEDYVDAISTRMKANRLEQTVLSGDWYLIAGKIAAARGDKATALTYFRKALKSYISKRVVQDEIEKLTPSVTP